MKKPAIKLLLTALISVILLSCSSTTNVEPWEKIFNGVDFTNWRMVGSDGVAEVIDSMFICHMTANTNEHTFLCTEKKYGDFILEMDVKTDSSANSGILIRCSDKPENCDTCGISLYGYQMKIDPTKRQWTGGIMLGFSNSARWLYDLKNDERARNAYKKAVWNHIRIEAIGSSVKVWINDIPTSNLVNSIHSEGYIAIKIHKLGNKPENEAWLSRFKNIRVITENPEKYTQAIDIPAVEVP